MKYVKLFESWLNEAEDSNSKELQNKIDDIMKKIPSIDKKESNFEYTGRLELLDKKYMSNKNLQDGITIYAQNSLDTGSARWTINPLTFISLLDKNDTADELHKFILEGMNKWIEKYGVIKSTGSWGISYNGKKGSTQDDKEFNKSFSKEERTKIINATTSGLKELQAMLGEVEKRGANLFSTEIKAGSPISPGYKLSSAHSKYSDITTDILSVNDTASWVKDMLKTVNDKSYSDSDSYRIDAAKAFILFIFKILTYCVVKLEYVKKIAESPETAVQIAGIYANNSNKYMAEFGKEWSSKIAPTLANVGVSKEKINQYAPTEVKPAEK